MTESALIHAQERMRLEGATDATVDAFTARFEQLRRGGAATIPEDSIDTLDNPVRLDDQPDDPAAGAHALRLTAIVKLNGGLGTSMGLDGPKCLIKVRGEHSFLDIVVAQVLAARESTGARLPLLLMDSFATRDATLAALRRYPQLPVADIPLDFLQSQEPKLREDNLEPVDHPEDPDLEWCPPGHGDLYPALWGEGILTRLLDAGFRYLFAANMDNLGATPDPRVAAWFARSGAPFASEITRRTPMDRKGGHLAYRKSDGQLILRETAQTSAEEMHYFTDEARHPYAHCNNLWFDLRALAALLSPRGGALDLPVIANRKTVDPADASTTPVIQLETAMGAAVEFFPGAQPLAVPRSRFLPVKTTDDLLLLRSDAYEFTADARLRTLTRPSPIVVLDKAHYKTIAGFESRFPHGAPSLVEARGLTVDGDWTFGRDVTVRGDVHLPDAGEARTIADGAVLDGTGRQAP